MDHFNAPGSDDFCFLLSTQVGVLGINLRAPPVPFEEIQSILHKELGKPLEIVNEYIDPMPIAYASIAQVHGARLKGS
ncbi:aarF domain-containing protein kinase [Spatholobus suberectus]|nr:aarF domain-containing protein kinase [Spatholobus suberectus]